MTRKEIMSLTERELEIAVGREVMGITPHLWESASLVNALDRASQDTPRYTFNTDAFLDVLDELTRRRLTDTYERIIQENHDPRAPLLQGPVPREECLRAAIIAVTQAEKSK